ncbi:MAG: polysaccharide export protein, partial [Bacteroidia bacterium]|nr:polysaccharide export protein [Bacteroidia bacterium]
NDILYIRVYTLDQDINMLFSAASGASQTGGSYQYFSEDAMYFSGFSVREDGNVDIPLLGLVQVKGKTIAEAKAIIEQKAREQLKDPTVLVKLANFKVTLLGEVLRPGTYTYFNNQATILEAIAKSGDLTDYGNRKEVLIIRPTVNGSKSYRINLQDKNLLTSPEYFIQPNDVIYVPPLKAKGIRMVATDYGVLISAVSSTIATLSIVITLILNLKK